MKSIIKFLIMESDTICINPDEIKHYILKLKRCKRKDQIKTKSISVERLIKLLKCYKEEKQDEHKDKITTKN